VLERIPSAPGPVGWACFNLAVCDESKSSGWGKLIALPRCPSEVLQVEKERKVGLLVQVLTDLGGTEARFH